MIQILIQLILLDNRLLPSQKWEVGNDKQHGGILSLDHYDIFGDGIPELIVSRDDGLIEVFSYDENDEPVSKHHQVCQFSKFNLKEQ